MLKSAMPKVNTIAARCAALSDEILRIVLDAGTFARRYRDLRHEINSINADLLAIKTALEIAHDEFSTVTSLFPPPFSESMSRTLEYCAMTGEGLLKILLQTSTGGLNTLAVQFAHSRERLRALRTILDLTLDFFPLFGSRSLQCDTLNVKVHVTAHRVTLVRDLLQRLHVEKEQTTKAWGSPQISLAKLEACANLSLQQLADQTEQAQMLADARSDSFDPELSPRRSSFVLLQLPSPKSTITGGIGAWLSNVVSHGLQKPLDRPLSIAISTSSRRSQSLNRREEDAPSRGTFYAESTGSGKSIRGSVKSSRKILRSRPVSTYTQTGVKNLESELRSAYAPTICNSEASILYQKITSDKVAIARAQRKELTKQQRTALDRNLCSITQMTAPSYVEKMLWQGADPKTEELEFGVFFLRAAYELSTDILDLLVEYGADITGTLPNSYFSALHAAVLGNRLESVQYLLSLGMGVELANMSGETALHIAARTPGTYAIARYLLEVGADVNADTREGKSPLQVALTALTLDSRERTMMVELLHAHGADGELNLESCATRGKGLSVLGLI
ncbi:hypothetical protein BDV95DRAFT_206084 [Massariosphaeria phaeospora]|uniref:Uncharacterized protein n=1 Tax=Massariosphaeria phaeospora TaxID=100035 RepID=A0A7C8I2E3_9PLEO|nr:hypothetical protein BDV95DRAFT_206084 [Massariosphaeria phaeospora]